MDPWQKILESLDPEYHKHKSMAEDGPYIKPVLYAGSRNKWRVTLQEIWPQNDMQLFVDFGSSTDLDLRIKTVAEELETDRKVKRISYDTWEFINKVAAEKFIIMYTLKWTQ